MRDYNFFSNYVFTKSRIKISKLILPFIFLVVIGSIVGSYIYFEYQISSREDDIKTQEAILNSSKVVKTRNELTMLEDEIAMLELMGEEVVHFDLQIQNEYTVTEFLTRAIVQSIPQNIVFNSYEIAENCVDIAGVATSYSDIAEFENSLRELVVFENIFVSDINFVEDDELYSFTLDIMLRGEEDD